MASQLHSSAVRGAVLALAADAVTAELVPALDARGVPALVLRGPAIARWFYAGASRSYTDVDLLVRACDQPRAAEILTERGFHDIHADLSERELETVRSHGHLGTHATTWERSGTVVDLHVTLNHVVAPPERVWEELWSTAETISVAGHAVPAPGQAAAGFIVAMHAAAHGSGYPRTLLDLERALAEMPREKWRDAAQLARRLDAQGEFAAGLSLLPHGAVLARELGIESAASVETSLRAAGAPPVALGFERLSRTRGARAKASLLAREVVPPPAFMRVRFPLARRGPFGLAAAYLWRPVSLVLSAGSGFVAWQRARGAAR